MTNLENKNTYVKDYDNRYVSESRDSEIYETDDAVVLNIDLPGVEKDSVSVSMDRGTLEITAERAVVDESKCENCAGKGAVKEVASTLFGRIVSVSTCPDCENSGRRYILRNTAPLKSTKEYKLPAELSTGEIYASYDNGVLCIIIEKEEAAKARKIEVQ